MSQQGATLSGSNAVGKRQIKDSKILKRKDKHEICGSIFALKSWLSSEKARSLLKVSAAAFERRIRDFSQKDKHKRKD